VVADLPLDAFVETSSLGKVAAEAKAEIVLLWLTVAEIKSVFVWERKCGGCFRIMEFLKLFNWKDIIQKPLVLSACFCLFQISFFPLIFNYLWKSSRVLPCSL
jgi:hypothetical protein